MRNFEYWNKEIKNFMLVNESLQIYLYDKDFGIYIQKENDRISFFDAYKFTVPNKNTKVYHRLCGPAIIYKNDEVKFFIRGHEFSKEEFWEGPSVILYNQTKIKNKLLNL